jgi:hypothetical protein
MAKSQKNFLKKHIAASMRNGVAGGNDFFYLLPASDITNIIQDIEIAIERCVLDIEQCATAEKNKIK